MENQLRKQFPKKKLKAKIMSSQAFMKLMTKPLVISAGHCQSSDAEGLDVWMLKRMDGKEYETGF